MRKLAIISALLLGLTGCGQSVDDVKRDAEFTKTCKDGGGHVYYNDFSGIFCSFREATK
jgi:hypothetical protein